MRTVIVRSYTVIYEVCRVVWIYRVETDTIGADGGSYPTENISLGVTACSSVDFSFYRFRRNGSVYGEVTVIVTAFSVNCKLRP